MCYSAQVEADYRKYVRAYGADLSLKEFFDLFWRRRGDTKVKIPKSMADAFTEPRSDEERRITTLANEFNATQAMALEQELFNQRKRLADAERLLQAKPTKAATESQRIATGKIEALLGRLADLHRSEPEDRDARIFPGQYAPVMVMENGRRIIKPMRYQGRPAGKPAVYDTKFPGTYNARLDNLEGFWKDLFGFSHGLVLMSAFYENVSRPGPDGTAQNIVLEFRPQPGHDMLVACLWSRWTAPGESELLSFAAITDEPPPEIAAAGHDRCIIPIRPENIDAWLNPDRRNLAARYAILDDRERPIYEHRLAA